MAVPKRSLEVPSSELYKGEWPVRLRVSLFDSSVLQEPDAVEDAVEREYEWRIAVMYYRILRAAVSLQTVSIYGHRF